ncbi:MAG: hypothetical protein CM15mP107_1630 [Bacteroidota bacterium]|nr:MAG: hypothetical protein CM15mP107_1630 [Bacteroidota bacterium]
MVSILNLPFHFFVPSIWLFRPLAVNFDEFANIDMVHVFIQFMDVQILML